MHMLTPEDVVSAACARIGLEPIQSMDDETLGGRSAAAIYRSVAEGALDAYPFTWARRTVRLAHLDEISLLGRKYMHALPPEALGAPLRLATPGVGGITDAEIEGRQIHSSAPDIIATIKFLPEPSHWSASFREAVTLAMAAELALAMLSDRATWAELRAAAFGPAGLFPRGGALGAAIAADAYSAPAQRLRLGTGGFLAGRS